jgi:hypothetical protein
MTIHGKDCSVGRYTQLSDCEILVEELPLRVWTDSYLDDLHAKMDRDGLIREVDATKCTIHKVHIVVKFKPGGIDELERYADLPYLDGVESYLKLSCSIKSSLNLMGAGHEVLQLGEDYTAIYRHWFPVRRDQYIARVARRRLLAELRLEMYRNMARYIRESRQLNLACRAKSEMVHIIDEAGYRRFNKVKLESPGFTRNSELYDAITGKSATFEYLLSLSDGKKSQEYLEKLDGKIAGIERELTEITGVEKWGKFPGAKLWLEELDRLEVQLLEGMRTSWLYDEFGKYTYRASDKNTAEKKNRVTRATRTRPRTSGRTVKKAAQ